MATDLSGLSQAASGLSALSGVAMVTPRIKGYNAQTLYGTLELSPMLFHIEDNNSVVLNSSITDHVVEDNTVVSDQIAISPEIVTVHGYIGELNTVLPSALQFLRTAQEKLLLVSGYEPELTAAALRGFNAAEQGYRLISNIANQFSQQFLGTGNKQQEFFQKWYSYWKTKTLFTVQTPWALFEDMAVQSFKMNQDSETEKISDVEITFKKIRFAATVYLSDIELSNRASFQSASLTSNGLSAGVPSPLSFGSLLA